MELYDTLSKVKKIHFVGIGGSGMCPIAEILFHQGYQLTGSDISESDTLERVRSYGIPVFMGQKAENIDGAELVVYTAAVKPDNPELVAAREKNIPTVERSVMLGMVARRYENAVAVSGTHGKTTTTAMITQILIGAGKDPSAVIGGKLPLIGGNGRVGHSDTIVCEACEYVDTFLQLHPAISVILNIDNDHLDYFGTVENTIRSFHQFAEQTSRLLVVNGDNKNAMKAVEGLEGKEILTYGFDKENDYYADEICNTLRAREKFVVYRKGEKLAEVTLSVPGKHNIYNALAAFAVADHLGIEPKVIAENLHQFTGVHRRFELLGEYGGVTVADDFAHHPTEIAATLTAAKQMGFSRVWAVFQPHTYSRTYMLLDDFAKVLQIADRVVLSEILAVRETNTYHIYAKDLADKIPGCVWFKTFDEISDYMLEHAKDGDLILTLGGGDVYKCANLIVKKYQQKN
ncbi:UDP-N-acetylmuramate--L-alanine ligase [Caprobacter fermentans]|uniref:UDP-N-acetylmuramate--L-alanine ligase n=1 Tax=Caproicibacter fermentans TaxID=2576756 RepID=A0A6N8I336_9FIRM|nr:UDP-N-acetylmuramate--L-alanine ligase [Caproicibacter fermentans]MVB11933.1 UDP-N-acetylmuramate--L-alanine ligase [Caproicibacter fermentans]OCM99910.1 UDP-N-acetylmuramate--L-alanine ligase [Clostridium sp. W14A]QNK41165.1 UDP-N-acetylmuramate--L-alanine ligase [Caproicibacter fermentans]